MAELQSLAYHKPRGLEMLQDRWTPGLDDHAHDALSYALMTLDYRAESKPTTPYRWS
jgi:hypothetical protein